MSPISESLLNQPLKSGNNEMQRGADDEELLELVKQLKLKIKIIGCGGGGCNTINRIVETGITDAEVIAANTDASHLLQIRANKKILLGRYTTRGLGAGARPQVGEEAAREAEEQLRQILDSPHIAIITAGLGGGTGTGGTPYIAKLCREAGALTLGIVTLPFRAEGEMRMKNARWGLGMLKKYCDTTIVIPNDKLLELVPNLPINDAFRVADEILMRTIKGITETLTKPGLVNLDFNDLKTIMKGAGTAMVGIGESDHPERRAIEAVEEALESPLIEHLDIRTAKGALIRVEGGPNMTIKEAETAAEMVNQRTSPDARIIWGCSVDPTLDKTIRVLVILTGVKERMPEEKSHVPIGKMKRTRQKETYRKPLVKKVKQTQPVIPDSEEEDLGLDLGIDIIE